MDQVSLPMRIALLVVLGFSGLWFSALRPRPAEVAPIDPPVVKAEPKPAAKATAKKDGKVKAGAKAAAAKPSVAKADPKPAAAKPAPAEPAPAKPAVAKADPRPAAVKPAAATPVERVLADVKAGRTTVLLFWDRRNADDRAVRQSVADIDRHGGKVRVHVAPIQKVGAFGSITRGVPVVTSPTVLVIDGKGQARTVGGFTVTAELDQLVAATLR